MKCFVRVPCLSVSSKGGRFDTTEDPDAATVENENTGEEGIEHENDREESKEETVENEAADAVVNTRGGKMM